MITEKSNYSPNQVARLKAALRKRKVNAKRIHVTLEDGEWIVFIEGSKKHSGSFPVKEDVIIKARELQKCRGTKLFVHNKDGNIDVEEPVSH